MSLLIVVLAIQSGPSCPKFHPGAFSGQRRVEDPNFCVSNESVCVARVHCWEISLDFLSVLSYPRFSLAFIVYHLLLGSSYYFVSYNCFLCVRCVGLLVCICQMFGYKDSYEDAC